jgi:hypothetical protein
MLPETPSIPLCFNTSRLGREYGRNVSKGWNKAKNGEYFFYLLREVFRNAFIYN